MRRSNWRTMGWGLGLVSLFLLTGVSRPLEYKLVRGTAQLPAGLLSSQKPAALLRENTNNQGCMGSKTLDLTVGFVLQNKTSKVLYIHENRAVFALDGASFPWRAKGFQIKGKKQAKEAGRFVLKPGVSKRIALSTYAFAPRKLHKTTDAIVATVPTSAGKLVLTFKGLKKQPMERGAKHAKMP